MRVRRLASLGLAEEELGPDESLVLAAEVLRPELGEDGAAAGEAGEGDG